MKKNQQRPSNKNQRVVITRREIEDDDIEERPAPSIEMDPAEETYAAYVRSQGKDGVVVKVYRQTQRGRQYCYLGNPDEIDDENVRLYHSKQPYAREEGMYYLDVFVHGERRNSFPLPIAPQVSTPGSDTAHSSNNGMETVVRLLQEQNARLESRLMTVQQQEREPIGALADAMLKLQQIQGGSGGNQMSADTLLKAIELGRTMGGDGGGDTWQRLLADVVREGMPVIVPLLQGLMQKQTTPNGGPPMAITGQQVSAAEIAAFKKLTGFLKKKCLAGSEPALYVELVLDNQDEYGQLLHWINAQEFSAFAALDPEIASEPYKAFFEFLFNGLRQATKGKNQVGPAEAGKTGDASNTPANGKIGPPSSTEF